MIWLQPRTIQLEQSDVAIVRRLIHCIVSGIRCEYLFEELHSSLGESTGMLCRFIVDSLANFS